MTDPWDETQQLVMTDVGTLTFDKDWNYITDPMHTCTASNVKSSAYYSTYLPSDCGNLTEVFGYYDYDDDNLKLYNKYYELPYYAYGNKYTYNPIDISYNENNSILNLKGMKLTLHMCAPEFGWDRNKTYCAGVSFTHKVYLVVPQQYVTLTYYRLLTFMVDWDGDNLGQVDKRVDVTITNGAVSSASATWRVCRAYVGPYPYNQSIGTKSTIFGSRSGYKANSVTFSDGYRRVGENVLNSTDVVLAYELGYNLDNDVNFLTATLSWFPTANGKAFIIGFYNGSSWNTKTRVYVKVNDEWKVVNNVKVYKDGGWKTVTPYPGFL